MNNPELVKLTETFSKAESDVEQLLEKLKELRAELKEALNLKNIAYKQLLNQIKGNSSPPPQEEKKEKKPAVVKKMKKEKEQKNNTSQ
jgi:uncharacterized membrane protein